MYCEKQLCVKMHSAVIRIRRTMGEDQAAAMFNIFAERTTDSPPNRGLVTSGRKGEVDKRGYLLG